MTSQKSASSGSWGLNRLSILVCTVLLAILQTAQGHGRLWEPPSRSTAFRRGFRTPPNYNDNESFCGGVQVMYGKNKGKCGPCGDAWHLPTPRPNEDGGTYGTKTIVRKYRKGRNITARVFLTTNHQGYFEFRLCEQPDNVIDDSCFEENPLEIVVGPGGEPMANGTTRFPVGTFGGMIKFKLRLPEDITCERCVLQWHYRAGNNWGICENGRGHLGCGPQEVYRACADIAIR